MPPRRKAAPKAAGKKSAKQPQQQADAPAAPLPPPLAKSAPAGAAAGGGGGVVRSLMSIFEQAQLETDGAADNNDLSQVPQNQQQIVTAATSAPGRKGGRAKTAATASADAGDGLLSQQPALTAASSTAAAAAGGAGAGGDVIRSVAQLLHGIFLIARTQAVQLAPRMSAGAAAAAAAVNTADASATAAGGGAAAAAASNPAIAPGLARHAVRLPLRPSMIAAIQAVVPAHIVDVDVLRRICECRALPAGMCTMPSPSRLVGAHQRMLQSAFPEGGIPTAATALAHFLQQHGPPADFSADSVAGSAAVSSSQARNLDRNVHTQQHTDFVLLRSPLGDSDITVPTEEQFSAVLQLSGFTAADARFVLFGGLLGAAAAARREAASAGGRKKESGSRRQRDVEEETATAAAGSPPAVANSAAAAAAPPAAQGGGGAGESDDSASVPSDLAPFLNAAKQRSVNSFTATEQEHARAGTDGEIRARRNAEALESTLGVVRSSIGPRNEQAGVVSVLQAIARSLVQSGFATDYMARGAGGGFALASHGDGDGTVTITSRLHGHQQQQQQQQGGGGAQEASRIASHFGGATSNTQSIMPRAVEQLRLLLSHEAVLVLYVPAGYSQQQGQQQRQRLDLSDLSAVAAHRAQSVGDFDAELARVGNKPELLSGVVFLPKQRGAVQ